MQLTTARIRGFRSISDVTLARCGALNVIIGKNNAGKSNLLLALNAFFECITNGNPVSISPPIGRAIDFHGGSPTAPIDISLTFDLSDLEVQHIREAIISAAPQMRNAVDGLNSNLSLVISVTIPQEVLAYAFVREIKLVKVAESDVLTEHLILRVSPAAATELAQSARHAQSRETGAEGVRRQIEGMRSFGTADVWDRVRGDFHTYMSYNRTEGLAPDIIARVNELARQAENYDAFVESAGNFAISLESEANAMRLSPLRTNVETFAGNEDRLPAYALTILSLVAAIPVLYLTERREPIGRREASLLLDLKVSRGGSDQLRRIQQTVSNLLGVEIDAFRGDSGVRRVDSPAELDVDRFVVQVNGAGIREALRLVLDYELKQPTLLLVEEPEIHLHPALETTMLRYLKSIGARCQIFVTTHSTNFLDTAEMKNVYLASRNGATSVQQIDTDEAEAILPRELGLRLSSLFMFDRLVFVEGPTDEEVLREWAATLDVNLGKASVGFISLGGVKNFAHYANQHTLGFLAKRQVGMWFVLDRDERDDAEIRRLRERLGDNARLVALERREIENYLLNPQAIARYLAERVALEPGLHQREITAEQVARDLDECADELRSLALRNRVAKALCLPLYPDRNAVLAEEAIDMFEERLRQEMQRATEELAARTSRISEVTVAEREELDARWDREKLSLAPGDHLLDRVFRRYGMRFKKERDSVRLAGHLSAGEIDTGIAAFLREIGAP